MAVVLTTLAATLCMQLGYFLWKLSAGRQPVIGRAPITQVLRALLFDRLWVGGFFATAIGWLLFVRATAIGEISLVQPLMSIGDIVLIGLAVGFLKERLGRQELAGVALTVVGALGLSWSAQVVPPVPWQGHSLALLTLGAGVSIGGLLFLARRRTQVEVPLALAVGLAFGTGAFLTEALTASGSSGWRLLLEPLLLAVVAANVAGLAMLQAAFQRGRAAVVVPLQLAVANALAVGAGVWVFDEQLGPVRLAAIALIGLGTAWMHHHAQPTATASGLAPASPDAVGAAPP